MCGLGCTMQPVAIPAPSQDPSGGVGRGPNFDSECQIHEPPGALGSPGDLRGQLGSFLMAAPRSGIGFSLLFAGGLASGAL